MVNRRPAGGNSNRHQSEPCRGRADGELDEALRVFDQAVRGEETLDPARFMGGVVEKISAHRLESWQEDRPQAQLQPGSQTRSEELRFVAGMLLSTPFFLFGIDGRPELILAGVAVAGLWSLASCRLQFLQNKRGYGRN